MILRAQFEGLWLPHADLASWGNIGVAITRNGTTMSYAQPSTAEKVFLLPLPDPYFILW